MHKNYLIIFPQSKSNYLSHIFNVVLYAEQAIYPRLPVRLLWSRTQAIEFIIFVSYILVTGPQITNTDVLNQLLIV